jgi:ABC-type glycerol-3-phosphate transport system substrate-binding protein
MTSILPAKTAVAGTRRGQHLLRCCLLACVVAAPPLACSAPAPRLTFSASAVGAEGAVIKTQLARFAALHPEMSVQLQVTPDAADQRHQLYVQWLNARAPDPDVLQLDIIWTAEFAAAGWIRPLDVSAAARQDFFPAALDANRWRNEWYALPWFVDVGLLYWRTDLMRAAPATLGELRASAMAAVRSGATRSGLVWQGARYEGLVTVFLEHLAAFGGGILDERGRVIVDSPAAVAALTFMRDAIHADGFVPMSTLTWQEEQTRFAFQNGQAAYMRNWPYAWALLQEGGGSAVAGRVGVARFPAADGGRPAAALGGAQLAINRYSEEPALAMALVEFLTASEQMLERARVAAQLPARRSLYASDELASALAIPVQQVRDVLEAAVARPVTPVYSEMSEFLQVRLHRALTNQQSPAEALADAAEEIRTLLVRSGLGTSSGQE